MRWMLAAAVVTLLGCQKEAPKAPPAPAPVAPVAVQPVAAPDAGATVAVAPPSAIVHLPDGGVLDGEALFKTKTCLACHGKDAKTPILPNYPRLAGQQVAYAEQQMRDIKSGARSNGQTAAMKGIMPLVSDEEIPALAGYVATLPEFGATPPVTPPGWEKSKLDGAALFTQKTCIACHGANAKTPLLPIYPRLAGQQPAYAEQQMKDIKAGVRSNGQTAVMKAIMVNVSDEEIHALAEYVSTLH